MDYEQIQKDLRKLDTLVAVKRAAREPHANKLLQIYRRGSEMYDCAGTARNKRGQTVGFMVAQYVNVAGYVLTWKATFQKNGKRIVTDITGFKSHAAAWACARRRLTKLAEKGYDHAPDRT